MSRDQRTSTRRRYRYRQLIAPMSGEKLPTREQFFAVLCQDISAGGIAFLLSSPPKFRQCAILLGRPQEEIFMLARVMHVEKIRRGECEMYRVGCQFTSRLFP